MINLDSAFQFSIPSVSTHHEYGEIDWNVPLDMAYFEGHFPNQPMLPAFAIVDANSVILAKLLGHPIQIRKIATARFSAPILPSMKIKIKIQKKSEDTWQCVWIDSTTHDQSSKTLAEMVLVLESTTASDTKIN